MKTWRMRLEDKGGKPPAPARALARLLLAALTLGIGCAGIAVAWKRPHEALGWAMIVPGIAGIAWAMIDRDRQFLHDRLAGTRLVMLERPAPNTANPT
jgi:hypothetical protein